MSFITGALEIPPKPKGEDANMPPDEANMPPAGASENKPLADGSLLF